MDYSAQRRAIRVVFNPWKLAGLGVLKLRKTRRHTEGYIGPAYAYPHRVLLDFLDVIARKVTSPLLNSIVPYNEVVILRSFWPNRYNTYSVTETSQASYPPLVPKALYTGMVVETVPYSPVGVVWVGRVEGWVTPDPKFVSAVPEYADLAKVKVNWYAEYCRLSEEVKMRMLAGSQCWVKVASLREHDLLAMVPR